MTAYPEWHIDENRGPLFLERAVEDEAVYRKVLDEGEVRDFSEKCTDTALLRLLNDATDEARINALHVIAARGKAPDGAGCFVQMWMKSPFPGLSRAALEAERATESDRARLIRTVVQAIGQCESDEVKRMLAEAITSNQADINALLALYYESPKRCGNLIKRLLRNDPSGETLAGVLAGLGRDKTVECISETAECLLDSKCPVDSEGLRTDLMGLVRNPVSYSHYGLMARIHSLRLLKHFIVKDKPRDRDRKTAEELVGLYRKDPNPEIRLRAREIVVLMGLQDEIDDKGED